MTKISLIKIMVFSAIFLTAGFLVLNFALAQSCPSDTQVEETQATLVGKITNDGGDPNLEVWFRYGKTASYGSETSHQSKYGTGVFCATIYGLESGTTYYYQAVAKNRGGTSYGEAKSFTTTSSGSAPTVTTNSATSISQNSATLNGSVNPNSVETNAWFEYGTTSSLGSTTGSQSVGSGNSTVSYSYSLSGLSSNTTYYFRAVASNSYGTTYGGILSFTTSADSSYSYSYGQPSIITQSASPVYQNSALLNGSVNPNGGVTSAWFQWGTTTNLNNTTTIQPVGAGASYLNYSAALTGLSANTTYYFRAVASSPSDTVYGSILSFTTSQASAPIITYQSTQPQVVYAQSASKSTITSPSLVLLISNIDKDVVEAREKLNYVVVYKNISQQKLSSVVLKVTTPVETVFLGSNPRGASVEGNNITYQVGDLGINEEGTINIRVEVKNSVRTNDTLIFATVLEYLDKDDNFHSNNHFLAVVVIGGGSLLAALISAAGFNWVWGLILGLIIGFLIYWFGLRKKFA